MLLYFVSPEVCSDTCHSQHTVVTVQDRIPSGYINLVACKVMMSVSGGKQQNRDKKYFFNIMTPHKLIKLYAGMWLSGVYNLLTSAT